MAGKKTGKRLLTWVLVLVMALSLLPLNALAEENDVPENTNPSIEYSKENRDAHLVKSATKNTDDTYTIQLESWVTGKVEQTTGSAPLDIVLVLDQSGSMAENNKLESLKTAVRDFVTAINENADKHNVEHRIAIVGFASNQTEGGSNWGEDGAWYNTGIFVNGTLKNYQTYRGEGQWENVYLTGDSRPEADYEYRIRVGGEYLGYYQSIEYDANKQEWGYWDSYWDRGWQQRWNPVTPKTNANDDNSDHIQVQRRAKAGYIGLTAADYQDALVKSSETSISTAIDNLSASGATRASYGMEMANNVFANNERREGRSRVVVFFTDGEPGQDGYDTNEAGRAIAQAHATKKTYDAKVFSVGMFNNNPSTHVGNFMDYVSSNYPDANASEPSYSWGDWTITSGDPDADKYYMTVKDGDLSTVFEKISGSILTSDVTAGKDTVLTDTLSQYFDFDNVAVNNGTVTGVTVKKVAYQGDGKWASDSEDITEEVTVGLNGKTVTVSGFDYSNNDNVVTDGTNGTNASGYKLVVTFNVKPDTDFKDWGASGRYVTNSDRATLAKDNDTFATVDSPNAYVETYQVTYKFDETAPDSATRPKDERYYISGQTADVKPPEESSVNAGGNTYTFNGWKNGEANVDETITISGDVTLIGSWSQTSNTADYTVNYRWNNEPIPGTKPTTGSKNCGETVTVSPTQIEGYTPVSTEEQTITIDADNSKNVINFCYYKNVTLTANSDTVTYNGEEQTVEGYTCDTPNVTFEGITATGSGTDAGTYDVTFSANPVGTHNNLYYVTAANPGKLTITPRSVTLTSESASKVYDGTPLTKHEVTVTGDGFVEGEVTDIRATGTVTNVSEGEVTNTIEYTTTDKFKANNYNITKHEGTLKITEAPTYKFDLSNQNTIKVDKRFVSKYGRSAEKSFTATVTIERKETYTAVVDPGSSILPNVPNNGSAVTGEPTYTKVGEATGTVTLKTDTIKAFDFGKDSTIPLKPGAYRITVEETNKGNDRYVEYDTEPYTHTYEFTVGNDGKISINKPITFTITNEYTKRHTAATPSKPTLNTGDHYAYVMGYPDGTVRPNGSITRAEVSAILFRLLSDKTRDEYFTTESSFTDVKAGAWYNNSIATLEKAGVIVDTAKGGAFRPNEAITRAELAAMLAQFSDAKPVKGVKFSDVSAEHWAYEAIAIAAKMGWIEGYPDGTFRPDATITRAEMMTLVNRALERVPSDEDHLLSKRVMLTFPDCKSGDWFYIAVQEATNSHTYERAATEKNGDEQWTALRANRDWTLLEK